jgi:hypothetical protein
MIADLAFGIQITPESLVCSCSSALRLSSRGELTSTEANARLLHVAFSPLKRPVAESSHDPVHTTQSVIQTSSGRS